MAVRLKRHHHKFHAKPVEHDGFRFDSKKEGAYYEALKLRVQAGEVVFFLRQVPFHLPGGIVFRADFLEFHADLSVHIIDVKGVRTETYKAKKRMVEALYPVEIEEC